MSNHILHLKMQLRAHLSTLQVVLSLSSLHRKYSLTQSLNSSFSNKKGAAVNISVVVLVAFAGQRSSCSDLVFSNKDALWCSTLLRGNTAQEGEFSLATNKTQVPLCQAMSNELNKCQPRNEALQHGSSDPQDKGPIDFLHQLDAKHAHRTHFLHCLSCSNHASLLAAWVALGFISLELLLCGGQLFGPN